MLDSGAPAPVAGNTYNLIQAVSFVGTFVSNSLPALNPGLAWNTAGLSNGVLSVIQSVATNPTNITFSITGSQLLLQWPADHTGWKLQAQTNNLSVGLGTNWATLPNSQTTNRFLAPLDVGNGSVFYRLLYP